MSTRSSRVGSWGPRSIEMSLGQTSSQYGPYWGGAVAAEAPRSANGSFNKSAHNNF